AVDADDDALEAVGAVLRVGQDDRERLGADEPEALAGNPRAIPQREAEPHLPAVPVPPPPDDPQGREQPAIRRAPPERPPGELRVDVAHPRRARRGEHPPAAEALADAKRVYETVEARADPAAQEDRREDLPLAQRRRLPTQPRDELARVWCSPHQMPPRRFR